MASILDRIQYELSQLATVACGRCKAKIIVKNAETCWYCTGWLCADCWDEYGHCGHLEAERVNELARQGYIFEGSILDYTADGPLSV